MTHTMKKSVDPRHQKRIKLVQEIFANSFSASSKRQAQFSKIDALIEDAAPQFPIGKIAKIDVAILRLACFELIIEKKEPPRVIIDEAIEIAKEYGGEGCPAFINGVLGTIYKKYYGG